MLEFLTDDAFGLKAKAISVEGDGPLQVVDAECDDSHSSVHVLSPGLHVVWSSTPAGGGAADA